MRSDNRLLQIKDISWRYSLATHSKTSLSFCITLSSMPRTCTASRPQDSVFWPVNPSSSSSYHSRAPSSHMNQRTFLGVPLRPYIFHSRFKYVHDPVEFTFICSENLNFFDIRWKARRRTWSSLVHV